MNKPDKCINQTLLIYCSVVIVEIFIIAYLLSFPWLILACIILYNPIKDAMNWPMPEQLAETTTENKE